MIDHELSRQIQKYDLLIWNFERYFDCIDSAISQIQVHIAHERKSMEWIWFELRPTKVLIKFNLMDVRELIRD